MLSQVGHVSERWFVAPSGGAPAVDEGVLVGGWVVAGMGGVLFLLSVAALCRHLWVLRTTPQSPGHLGQKQATLSLAIKWILPLSLLGRSLSVAASVEGLGHWGESVEGPCRSLRECWLPAWPFMLLSLYPGYLLNTLFILCSLFWGWVIDLAKARQRPFELLLREWAALACAFWVPFVALFLAAATLPSADWPYLAVVSLNLAVGVLLLLAWCYHAVVLWRVVRKQEQERVGGRFTWGLFAATFAVLFLGLVRFIAVLVVALRPTLLTRAVIIVAEVWAALFELLPAAILLVVVSTPIAHTPAHDLDGEVQASFGVPSSHGTINSASDSDSSNDPHLFLLTS
ncbi:MAG: hypothetical protein Q8P67_00685, partial [archaeon]|nr:hypothetical protein [archaeon]